MRIFHIIVLAALAVTGVAVAPAAAQPLRLRGIVTALSGETLYMKANDGGPHEVKLDGTKLFSMVPATLADIKTESFVGIVSVPEKDGLRAVVINVLPDVLRGFGEGQGPWDTAPGSRMTNAYVTSEVTGVSAQTLRLKYKGAAGEVAVTPETQIVTMVPSDLRELSPGVHILVFAVEGPDGALKANALIAGHAGLVPPL